MTDPGLGRFPIQTERGAAAHPLFIPWSLAEEAYSVYVAQWGACQTLERLAQRGGFAPSEMDAYRPGWREAAGEVALLEKWLDALAGEWARAVSAQIRAEDERTRAVTECDRLKGVDAEKAAWHIERDYMRIRNGEEIQRRQEAEKLVAAIVALVGGTPETVAEEVESLVHERDAIRQRVIDLFDAGFRTRGAESMTAADALRELVGLPAQGAAHAMARHPEVRARERAEEERDAARAEVERLTRERDEAKADERTAWNGYEGAMAELRRILVPAPDEKLDDAAERVVAERDAARKEADRLRMVAVRARANVTGAMGRTSMDDTTRAYLASALSVLTEADNDK